jgi:hypothetical protein
MKKITAICLCLCMAFIHSAFAVGDSVIQYRNISGSLTASSEKSEDGHYYAYVPIRMAKGDIARFQYKSTDYITAFFIRDSAGHSDGQADDPLMFKSLGSSLSVPFRAPETNYYYFIFTTKESGATGKYNVDIFYYNSNANTVTNTSSFCDKLKFLLENDPANFEFVKGAAKSSVMMKRYQSDISLDLEGASEIRDVTTGFAYRIEWKETEDLSLAQKKYDEMVNRIAACVPNAKKKVYTVDMVGDVFKNDFVARTDFEEPGQTPGDMQAMHGMINVKWKISINLEKAGAGKYQLKLEIK